MIRVFLVVEVRVTNCPGEVALPATQESLCVVGNGLGFGVIEPVFCGEVTACKRQRRTSTCAARFGFQNLSSGPALAVGRKREGPVCGWSPSGAAAYSRERGCCGSQSRCPGRWDAIHW